MKLQTIAGTIGALALSLGIACAASASTSSEAALQIGAGAQVAPVANRHCIPLFGYRKVHFSSSSRIRLVRKIIGWKCFPIATLRPRLPIPNPGPYHKRPGKIGGGLVIPRAGR